MIGMEKIIKSKKGTYINTMLGKAYYSHTEKEDKHGRWNQSWATIRGEFVIHRGDEHDVYIT